MVITATLAITAAMSLVTGMAIDAGIDPAVACRIVELESGWNQYAVGDWHMTSLSTGLWQFQPGTWVWARQSMGLNNDLALRTDWAESTRTALWLIAKGYGRWWSTWEIAKEERCFTKC